MSPKNRYIRAWLLTLCFFVLCMIVVGGLTRLTGSGLSMVNWRPLMGALPPLGEEQWLEVFEAYRQSPEYQKINKGMSLEAFKSIFYWEYGHRLLGRVVGVIFLLPFFFFIYKRWISLKMFGILSMAFALGGGQGLLGWYMVKSGLIDVPQVSHFRLAAHLSLALFLLCFLMWVFWSFGRSRLVQNPTRFYFLAPMGLLILTVIQIFFGAFTAGLKAGHLYNTFPTMNGEWVPTLLFAYGHPLKDIFYNETTIQFIHRLLGLILLLGSFFIYLYARRFKNRQMAKRFGYIFGAILVQVALGVGTLLGQVPIVLAVCHQVWAGVVLLLILYTVYLTRHGFTGREVTALSS